jgi:hypothetical protein
LLDNKTKGKLINLGQSLDSAKLTDALGYIDLKNIIRCLAHAVQRHIDYSKGFLFIEELEDVNEEFSYQFKDELKI